MSVIAFVPARGGSKSIPEKNIAPFCGQPLIFWILKELQDANVDQIIVATDSRKIKDIVESFNLSKVEVYNRSVDNADDDSSTQSVILEYMENSDLLDSDLGNQIIDDVLLLIGDE